jgi:hypothetical protein
MVRQSVCAGNHAKMPGLREPHTCFGANRAVTQRQVWAHFIGDIFVRGPGNLGQLGLAHCSVILGRGSHSVYFPKGKNGPSLTPKVIGELR